MQPNLEDFFILRSNNNNNRRNGNENGGQTEEQEESIRVPSIVDITSSDQLILLDDNDACQFHAINNDNNNQRNNSMMMNLLSGKQNSTPNVLKKGRGRPKKQITIETEDSIIPIDPRLDPSAQPETETETEPVIDIMPTTYSITLKITPEKLQKWKESRVNVRDLFNKTTVVKRKLMVTLKVTPHKLAHVLTTTTITDGTSKQCPLEIIGSSPPQIDIDTEDDDDHQTLPRVNIKDILGISSKKPTSTTTPEIEKETTTSTFRSKISASEVLKDFKERQALLPSVSTTIPTAATTTSDQIHVPNGNSFFHNVQERAAIAKLMKEKGLNKPMILPSLRKQDFLIADNTDLVQPRIVELPKRILNPSVIDNLNDTDIRLGPNKNDCLTQPATFTYTTKDSIKSRDVMNLVHEQIVEEQGNSRLVELLAMVNSDSFQTVQKDNNVLYSTLFKPCSPSGLLIPSKKITFLKDWFQTNFAELPKKKPNRAHLFRKNQEDEFTMSMDSFIANDSFYDQASQYDQEEIEKDQSLPILIVTGDHGIGKTATIETILSDLNAYIYNVDSATMDKREVKEMVIHQKYDKHVKQDSCVLFDEIPPEEDEETFWMTLRGLLMITRKPIVFIISNEERSKLPHWLNQGTIFEFKKINESLMLNYLAIVALTLNCQFTEDALKVIMREADYDLKKCINELQLLTCGRLNDNNDDDAQATNGAALNIVDLSGRGSPITTADDYLEHCETIEQLDRSYYKRSLQFDLEHELASGQKVLPPQTTKSKTQQSQMKKAIYDNATAYYNSKASNRNSKRINTKSMVQFISNLYNLNSEHNWNQFRLEFYEFLLQMAITDTAREGHFKKFTIDPTALLSLPQYTTQHT